MRISLDIDDTLVCSPLFPSEQFVPRWRRLRYNEPMRLGARSLLEKLVQRDCQIWVYTTSYRSPSYLSGWFRCLGIRLGGVVNQDRHDRIVGRNGPSKYPPAFGIDLHVDDSEGVGLEGRRHGFSVVVIPPEDPDWAARVLEAVDLKLRSAGPSGIQQT